MTLQRKGARGLGRLAAAAALGVLVLASPGRAAGPEDLLPVGEKAPSLRSVDLGGAPFVLEEELAGGPVFLVFWSIF